MQHQPLILTLKLDTQTFAYFDALRREHFPPERNIVPAHITLFHALGSERESIIDQTLRDVAATTVPFALGFPSLRFLGRGVAAEVDAPALLRARAQLASAWNNWLGAQERQRFRPHITIQNKVEAPVARATFDQLSLEWHAHNGLGEGFILWRYLGGPWERVTTYMFGKPNHE